jgi:opacity protein-like surface antigen
LLGVNLSGDVEDGKGGIGGSVGYFGARLGFEFDVERHWHFFKDRDIDFVPNCGVVPRDVPCVDVDTRAWSLMGNVVMPIRLRGAANWRPYATAGLGLIHASFADGAVVDISQNNFAFNVGGGVMYSLNGRVGLRGDLRYFRALVDEDKREGGFFKDYGFWRTTFGVTFGFPR